MKLNLTQAVNEIKLSQSVPYSKNLLVHNSRLLVDIKFKNYDFAREFARSWSYMIRNHYDGAFKLCLNYYNIKKELVPLTLTFQTAIRAKELIDVECSARYSDDYE